MKQTKSLFVRLHIWVAPRPPFGYSETNAEKIKESMLQLNQMTAFLIRINPESGRRGAEKDWALNAYCEIEAQRNYSINNLREDLLTLLEEMAYKKGVYTLGGDMDTDENWLDSSKNLLLIFNSELKQKLKRYFFILRGDVRDEISNPI